MKLDFFPIKKVFRRFSKFPHIYNTWTSSDKNLIKIREPFWNPSIHPPSVTTSWPWGLEPRSWNTRLHMRKDKKINQILTKIFFFFFFFAFSFSSSLFFFFFFLIFFFFFFFFNIFFLVCMSISFSFLTKRVDFPSGIRTQNHITFFKKSDYPCGI